MNPEICSHIKQSISRYMRDQLETSIFHDHCVVTLPIKTLDGRWISVLVEDRLQDRFLVHDGGKTDSELFGQGVKMSESALATQTRIAAKFGVTIADRMIQTMCSANELGDAIMAVAQTAAMLTVQLVWSAIEVEEARIHSQVAEALTLWRPADAKIEQNVELEGAADIHTFNFVSYAVAPAHRNAAISILASSRPLEKAERYGYIWLDMEKRAAEYQNWARLAVIPRAETWSKRALNVVKYYANDTLELTSEAESIISERIPESMSRLVNAEVLPRPMLL